MGNYNIGVGGDVGANGKFRSVGDSPTQNVESKKDTKSVKNDGGTPKKRLKGFANLSDRELAARVALNNKGPLEPKLRARSPYHGKHFTKCEECEMRATCKRAFKDKGVNGDDTTPSRCIYELEGRAIIRDRKFKEFGAFVGSDPRDLLEKIMVIYTKLECIVLADPSYPKVMSLYYALVNLYKMKFGEKYFMLHVAGGGKGSIEGGAGGGVADGNTTLDIKGMMRNMERMHASDMGKTINAEYEPMDDKQGK